LEDQAIQIFNNWLKANPTLNRKDVESWIGNPGNADDWDYSYDACNGEIGNVLNDYKEDLGVAIPDELIAYKLQQFLNTTIDPKCRLIKEREKFINIDASLSFIGQRGEGTNPKDVIDYRNALIEANPTKKNEYIKEFNQLLQQLHIDREYQFKGAPTLNIEGIGPITITTSDTKALIKRDDDIRMYDMDTCNEIPIDQEKFIHKFRVGYTADPSELDSIVGNKLASLIRGEDGISILDLPRRE
jgi:hypothetical protein